MDVEPGQNRFRAERSDAGFESIAQEDSLKKQKKGMTMKTLGIGMIGAGFMAKAHSVAYAGMPMFFWPAPAKLVKKTIVDLDEAIAKEARDKFNFENYSTDWRELMDDPEIDIIDICTPNDVHAEIAIAAAKAGKHILCEKPLALTADEAREMYLAAKENNITTMVAFNYRRTPAIQLAKKYIEEGKIGEILDFRGTYLQDWSADPNSPLSWRFDKNVCGTGALGDIGTHVVDICRFLVGEFSEVNSRMKTYIDKRPLQQGPQDQLGAAKKDTASAYGEVDVDDHCCFMIKCHNGAFGTIEATRNAWGRKNYITVEIHGTKGSIFFNYEHRDELQICLADDPDDCMGFKTVITGPNHPYGEALWPVPALGIGYTETKIVECHDFVDAIVNKKPVSPDFKDGYAVELIADAIVRSAASQKWEPVADLEA